MATVCATATRSRCFFNGVVPSFGLIRGIWPDTEGIGLWGRWGIRLEFDLLTFPWLLMMIPLGGAPLSPWTQHTA
jgi:hypothetical protein